MKGRSDPNLPGYARTSKQRVSANGSTPTYNSIQQQQQAFMTEKMLEEMNLRDLKNYKAKMESEYAKIPITASSKSLQVRKRKEELEYELDVIEKQIMRV